MEKMKFSNVVTIGEGNYPIIGLVGIVHGDETVGLQVLDNLKNNLSHLKQGRIHLIYANLPACETKSRYIEIDLNRCFPGKEDGKLEEKIAYDLREILSSCDFVIDIHSTTLPHPPFVISPGSESEINTLAQNTGLGIHVIADPKLASKGTLMEFVSTQGKGAGLLVEVGQHQSPESKKVAMSVVLNVLRAYGVIDGEPLRKKQEKYFAQEFIQIPTLRENFTPYDLKNFQLLAKGESFGKDSSGKEYSLDEDCYVLLFSDRMDNDRVFLKAAKI